MYCVWFPTPEVFRFVPFPQAQGLDEDINTKTERLAREQATTAELRKRVDRAEPLVEDLKAKVRGGRRSIFVEDEAVFWAGLLLRAVALLPGVNESLNVYQYGVLRSPRNCLRYVDMAR